MHQIKGKVKPEQKVFIHVFTPEYVKDRQDLRVFSIYPDSRWDEGKWGKKPCLGHVRETSEYWAKYAAMTAGMYRENCTFDVEVVPTSIMQLKKDKLERMNNVRSNKKN